MDYLETLLAQEERTLYTAQLHWIAYFFPTLLLAVGVFECVDAFATNGSWYRLIWYSVVASVGLQLLLGRMMTEIAVTSKRFIVKNRLFRRQGFEMNAGQVESVALHQSILGRLLDFGTVYVRGTGTGIERIPNVAAPLPLREAVRLLRDGVMLDDSLISSWRMHPSKKQPDLR